MPILATIQIHSLKFIATKQLEKKKRTGLCSYKILTVWLTNTTNTEKTLKMPPENYYRVESMNSKVKDIKLIN